MEKVRLFEPFGGDAALDMRVQVEIVQIVPVAGKGVLRQHTPGVAFSVVVPVPVHLRQSLAPVPMVVVSHPA